MATKNNPGEFDCYAAADPDEPLFILRANDELAPALVNLWAMIRSRAELGDMQNVLIEAIRIADAKPPMSMKKYDEALRCASSMIEWKASHVEN